jgi:hypothetical protein
VAGIAAGSGGSFSGIAKGANIMAVQVFSRFDNPSFCGSLDPCILAFNSDILAGLEHVYARRSAHNVAAVNLSLGSGQNSSACDNDSRKPVIDLLRSANIATVIASGNDGSTDAISAPACISSAVSVGSTGDGSGGAILDVVSGFSNSASFLSLLAPGQWINSSLTPGTGFDNFQGTSMATPHVAGAFALLKEAVPNLSVSDGLNCLQETGRPVTDERNGITKPRVQILEALFCLVPGSVEDLRVDAATQSSVTLIWTASGDSGDAGTAATYDIRFSTKKFTDADWTILTQVSGEPAPRLAGTSQSKSVNSLKCGRTYFFAIKSRDKDGNESGLSNIASGKTAPCNKLTVSPRVLPTGEAGTPYSSGPVEIAGLPNTASPFHVQIDAATLPPGVRYNAAQRTFTGTPTEPNTFNVSAVITDAVGSELNAKLKLKIAKPIEITTNALKAGKVGKPYAATPRAKNGVKAYKWTVTLDSALPSGSTFEFDPGKGKISVLATAPGPVDVTFQVTDAAGGSTAQTVTLMFN